MLINYTSHRPRKVKGIFGAVQPLFILSCGSCKQPDNILPFFTIKPAGNLLNRRVLHSQDFIRTNYRGEISGMQKL
jgi:hypothetical protein